MRLLAGVLAGASVHVDARRRRVALAAGRCAASSSRSPGWARASTQSTDTRRSTIHGGDLHAITHAPEVAERAGEERGAAGRSARRRARPRVIEPAPTRDHTERALAAFGAPRRASTASRSRSTGGQRAAAAEALPCPATSRRRRSGWRSRRRTPGSRVEIERRRPEPDADGLLERPAPRGRAWSRSAGDGGVAGEPRGHDPRHDGDRTGRFDIAPEEVPGLIDELPALAALAAMPRRHVDDVRGAASCASRKATGLPCWSAGFRALGVDVDEFADGFTIGGSAPLTGGDADAARRSSAGDGVRDRRARGRGAACSRSAPRRSAVSYPGFFEMLERLASR